MRLCPTARRVRERRLFPGESTELILEIFNRKPLPIPWLRMDDEIPVELARDLAPVPATGSSWERKKPPSCLT